MTGESFPRFPHASAHSAALAARTHYAVADNADVRNPVSVVERVNAYGYQASVMVSHAPAFSVVQLSPATVRLDYEGAA